MRLENNQQLYDYLASIGTKLSARGAVELSRIVMMASHYAGTVPATEFLGESRIALRRVEKEQNVLTQDEHLEVADVVRQLDEAFGRQR